MKDEELAEQFADGYATPDLEDSFRVYIFEASKDGFLAGLKAGRPQWHKPSEKLPDQYNKVLNEDGFGVFYDGKHWRNNDAEQDICNEPKYWCEIPTFDK